MYSPTLFFKLVFILQGILLFALPHLDEQSRPVFLIYASGIQSVIALIFFIFVQKRYLIFLLPLLSLLFAGRLMLEKPIPPANELWKNMERSRNEKPDYDARLKATARIDKRISGNTFLIRISVLSGEKRIRKFHKFKNTFRKKRNYKRRKYSDSHQYENHGKNRYSRSSKYSRKSTHRKSYSRNKYYFEKKKRETANPGIHRKKKIYPSRYKKRKRGYFKKVWVEERGEKSVPLTPEEANPFPVLAKIYNTDRALYPGCSLELNISGRGTPVRIDGGFASYIKRKGGSGYIRLSGNYHISEIRCPEPGIRETIRSRMEGILEHRFSLSPDAKRSALGMLLGESSRMGRNFKSEASSLGILHVFAASGLHLGIFYGMLYLPLSAGLGKKRILSLMMPLPFAFAYLYLLNFPVSLTRAFIFALFFALQSIIHRRSTVGNHLLNGAVLLLFFFPGEFLSVSGALSFGAVTGILYFYGKIRKIFYTGKNKLLSFVFDQLAISLSASLFTAPVIVYFFGNHPHMGLFANGVIVPLVGLVLPLLYGTVIADLLSVPAFIAYPFHLPVQWGMESFVYLVRAISPFSLSVIYSHESPIPVVFSLPVIASLALMILTLLLSRHDHSSRNDSSRRRFWLLVAWWTAFLFFGPLGFFVKGL